MSVPVPKKLTSQGLSLLLSVVAVHKGERPEKPRKAKALEFSDTLWRAVLRAELTTARPTTKQILCCLQGSSHTWELPPEYPIPDDLMDSDAGSVSTFGDKDCQPSAPSNQPVRPDVVGFTIPNFLSESNSCHVILTGIESPLQVQRTGNLEFIYSLANVIGRYTITKSLLSFGLHLTRGSQASPHQFWFPTPTK